MAIEYGVHAILTNFNTFQVLLKCRSTRHRMIYDYGNSFTYNIFRY